MAKLQTTGRLGNVQERSDGKWLSFGVAEPSYKAKDSNEWVTPWFNFLIPGESKTAEFLKKNAAKIDVVQVEGNCRQVDKEDTKNYYINVNSIDVITWKKQKETDDDTPFIETEEEDKLPWDQE